MYKLAAIGAAVVALAVPASAASHSVRPHRAQAPINCPQTVVILPGRGYGYCGGHLWVRDSFTGELTTAPTFWAHLRLDRPDDHP